MKILLLYVVFALSVQVAPGSETLYVGAYTNKGSKGIYLVQFDPRTGALSTPKLAVETPDPSFLAMHPTKPVLYAVNEGQGTVSAFSIDARSGALKLLNQMPSGGKGPCHLAVDHTGRMLVVANYDSGSFATFPIQPNGSLGSSAQTVQFTGSGPDKARQEGPHAHCANFAPDNRYVLVNDLGTDRTMIYAVTPATAKVAPADPPFASANPGAGPRHLAFGPRNRFVYVLNEMQSSVTRFHFDQAKGAFQKMDTVSTLASGFQGKNTAAEIAISHDGQTLYASNRGEDSIAVFRVDEAGALHLRQTVSSGGKTPRSFAIDVSGKWLLAANQDSDNVKVLHIDPRTGALAETAVSIAISSPVCVISNQSESH